MSPILTGIIASGISGNLTPPWSPEGGYDALATVTVGSTALSSITFSGIPTGYKHLQIRASITPGTASGDSYGYIRFNEDASSSYAWHRLGGGDGQTPGSSGSTSQTSAACLLMTGAGNSNLYPAPAIIDVLDYSQTSKNKTIRSITGIDQNTNSGVGGTSQLNLFSGLWQNTSAINSITLIPNSLVISFKQYSSFALYGVK